MSEKARPILESLQVQATEEQPNAVDPKDPDVSERLFRALAESSDGRRFDEAELHRIHQSHIDLIRSTIEMLPTRYEDPLTYTRLSVLVPEVAQAARELGYDLPETVSLGTVSTGRINAHVIPVDLPRSEYLLVFNRHLLHFTDYFSRFIASRVGEHCIRYTENQSFQEANPSDAEVRLLGDLVYYMVNQIEFVRDDAGAVGVVIALDIDLDTPLIELTSPMSKVFKELLTFSMPAFAVAHELAHIIQIEDRAHLPHKKEEERDNFCEEVACDAIGCRIAAQAAARQCVGKYVHGWQMAGTAGSLFFLSCLNLAEKMAYVLKHGADLPQVMTEVDCTLLEANVWSSYPTAVFRRYVVRSVLENEFKRGGAPKAGDWIFGAHDWTVKLFDQCWAKLRVECEQRFEGRKKIRERAGRLLREQ